MKEKTMKIESPAVALLTPMNRDLSIDYEALNDYLNYLSSAGVNTVITNGSTAEFPSLNITERIDIVNYVNDNFRGSIINNVSSCCLDESIELCQKSPERASILILPPFYYSDATKEGLLKFFTRILSKTTSDCYLYNFPFHTTLKIPTDIIKKLKNDFPHLAGLKDSGGDWDKSLEYREDLPWASIFIGGDYKACDALNFGFQGSATGRGNPFVEFLVEIRKSHQSNNNSLMLKLQSSFDEWNNGVEKFKLPEITVTKAAMRSRLPGFPLHIRPPFSSTEFSTDLKDLCVRVRELLP